jgi:hypothetical protein
LGTTQANNEIDRLQQKRLCIQRELKLNPIRTCAKNDPNTLHSSKHGNPYGSPYSQAMSSPRILGASTREHSFILIYQLSLKDDEGIHTLWISFATSPL